MEESLKGKVIVIQFPFSDLTGSKRRPALIVTDWGANDVILAQITSVFNKDNYAIGLSEKDFSNGSLKKESFMRSNKLFTANKVTFLQMVGTLTPEKMKEVTDTIYSLIR